MTCSSWRHWWRLLRVWFTGVKNTVQWIHGRSWVDRNARSWCDGGAWGVDECAHLNRHNKGSVTTDTKQTDSSRSSSFSLIPFYLVFADCAHWSCATVLTLRRSRPSHLDRRRGGGAEGVGGSLTSSFVHAERGLENGTRRWNRHLNLWKAFRTNRLSSCLLPSSAAAGFWNAAHILIRLRL